MNFLGYMRNDGKIGIRNKILILALDECCEGIARTIAKENDDTVVLTNWYTCMLGGNEESFNQMIAVAQNPNVAAVLVLSMGCGSILPQQIEVPILKAGKPIKSLVCIAIGGTRKTVQAGKTIIEEFALNIKKLKRESFPISKLIIGVKCGGSDTSSGIASNPSVGAAVDKLVDAGGICIAGELFELLGCEDIISKRAVSEEVAHKIITLIENERKRWSVEGTNIETMSIGNSLGGLTTIEEKALGTLYKTGTRPIVDILQINEHFIDYPTVPGMYLSEVTMLCGGAGINFAALGTHIILWTTGGAGFNNALVPVIRVSGNHDLFNDDCDIDATGIMDGTMGEEEIANKIIDTVVRTASGELTCIEGIGDSTMTLYQKDQRLDKLLQIGCVKK